MAEILSSAGSFTGLQVSARCSVCGNIFHWNRVNPLCPECYTEYKIGIIVTKITKRGEKRGPKEKYKIKWIYTDIRPVELDCC